MEKLSKYAWYEENERTSQFYDRLKEWNEAFDLFFKNIFEFDYRDSSDFRSLEAIIKQKIGYFLFDSFESSDKENLGDLLLENREVFSYRPYFDIDEVLDEIWKENLQKKEDFLESVRDKIIYMISISFYINKNFRVIKYQELQNRVSCCLDGTFDKFTPEEEGEILYIYEKERKRYKKKRLYYLEKQMDIDKAKVQLERMYSDNNNNENIRGHLFRASTSSNPYEIENWKFCEEAIGGIYGEDSDEKVFLPDYLNSKVILEYVISGLPQDVKSEIIGRYEKRINEFLYKLHDIVSDVKNRTSNIIDINKNQAFFRTMSH